MTDVPLKKVISTMKQKNKIRQRQNIKQKSSEEKKKKIKQQSKQHQQLKKDKKNKSRSPSKKITRSKSPTASKSRMSRLRSKSSKVVPAMKRVKSKSKILNSNPGRSLAGSRSTSQKSLSTRNSRKGIKNKKMSRSPSKKVYVPHAQPSPKNQKKILIRKLKNDMNHYSSPMKAPPKNKSSPSPKLSTGKNYKSRNSPSRSKSRKKETKKRLVRKKMK